MSTSRSVLIGFDGSADAYHAIREAAGLLPGAKASLVTPARTRSRRNGRQRFSRIVSATPAS